MGFGIFAFLDLGGWEQSEKMSKPSALDLATGLGGKIAKEDVISAVDKYN